MRDRRPRLYVLAVSIALASAAVAGLLSLPATRLHAAPDGGPSRRATIGDSSRDEATLRELKETLWPRAYRDGDPALLDRILASEFELIGPDGQISNKAKELDYVSKNRSSYLSFRFEIRRLEIFENGTAVISGRGVAMMPASDPEGSYEYQSSNVLIRREGRWQAIASHVSGVRSLTSDPSAGTKG